MLGQTLEINLEQNQLGIFFSSPPNLLASTIHSKPKQDLCEESSAYSRILEDFGTKH